MTSQTISSGLIATFIAIVPMMVALVGLALGKWPTRLEILGTLIGFGDVIFWCKARVFAPLPWVC